MDQSNPNVRMAPDAGADGEDELQTALAMLVVASAFAEERDAESRQNCAELIRMAAENIRAELASRHR